MAGLSPPKPSGVVERVAPQRTIALAPVGAQAPPVHPAQPAPARYECFCCYAGTGQAIAMATIHKSGPMPLGVPADDRIRPKTRRFIGADTREPLHRRRIGTEPDSHAVSRASLPAIGALLRSRPSRLVRPGERAPSSLGRVRRRSSSRGWCCPGAVTRAASLALVVTAAWPKEQPRRMQRTRCHSGREQQCGVACADCWSVPESGVARRLLSAKAHEAEQAPRRLGARCCYRLTQHRPRSRRRRRIWPTR
jgi:hypothetical protein